jgi:Ni,Fe-hydrogenase III small subunit
MIEFIFVAVVCMGQQCDFIASNKPITREQCQQTKRDFAALPFKPEVTVAASQCMVFNGGERI